MTNETNPGTVEASALWSRLLDAASLGPCALLNCPNCQKAIDLLTQALAAQSQPAATVQEVQTGNIVDRDAARLALFNAIRAIKIGNSDDDKLILDNLRKSGFWICRIGDFGSTVAAATRTLSPPASQSVGKMREALEGALEWIDAIPADVVANLPAMPGFDRDKVDELIAATTERGRG